MSFATRTDMLASFDSLVPLDPVFGWRISNRHGIHRVHAIVSVIRHCDVRRCPERASCPYTRFFLVIFQFIVVYVCVRLNMLLAPGHPTPRQTFRKLNKWSVPQLVLSLVTIGELQVPLPCVLTSCGIHCTLDVAPDMPLCFVRFTMDNFASVCLSSLSLQMLALNATTSINPESSR